MSKIYIKLQFIIGALNVLYLLKLNGSVSMKLSRSDYCEEKQQKKETSYEV